MAKARSADKKAPRSASASNLSQPTFLVQHANAIFIGMIALLLVIFFHEAFFSGKVFFVPDNVSSIVYEEGYLKQADEAGVNPFWNPYVFSGMPTWGSSSPGHGMYLHSFLDPLKPMVIMQVYGWVQAAVNILPLPSMFWDIFNFFLLGAFTYLLGVRRKFEPWVAFLVAVSVVFSLYSLNWIMAGHNTKITVFAFLPAILLLVDLLFEKRSLPRISLLVLALHFTFNSGHVQMVFYSLMVVGLYVLYKWYSGESFGKVALVSAIAVGSAAFAFLMLSGPYFAAWEYKDFSIRGAGSGGSGHGPATGGLDYDYATLWSFSPIEVLTFFVPSFVGFGSPTYWGSMSFTESPIYLGVVVSFFALLGIVLRPKDKFVHLWIALGVIALLVSFGRNFSPLYDLFFHYVPFFDNFRIPSMILFLMALSMGMLAGVGLTEIVRLLRERRKGEEGAVTAKLTKAIWIPVGVAAVLVLALMGMESSYKSTVSEMMKEHHPQYHQYMEQIVQYEQAGRMSELPEQLQNLTLDRIYSMALNDALLALLFMALAGLVLWAFVKGKLGITPTILTLLLLLVVDWWVVDSKPMHMVPMREQEQSLAKTDVVDFLKQDTTVYRVLPAGNHSDDNWYVAYSIQNVAGYHPAKLKLYDDVRNTMFGQFQYQSGEQLQSSNWAMLSMLNTKYVVTPGDWQVTAPFLKPVFFGNKETVYENQYVLPRAFFVGSYEVITDDEVMFQEVSTLPGYRPDRVAYLSTEPPTKPATVSDSLLAGASATLVDFGINGFAYDLETPVDAILKLSEVYYPSGWTATLDGKPIDILRSDYVLRAVVIPAGKHRLEMHYQPETYEAGLIVTTVTNYALAAVLLLSLVLWLRRRQGKGKAAATTSKDNEDQLTA
ncbi:MAG: YfhO family protein [Bacteroidetes bacterium]|nr:YfhO family protein [Bacteroidota bacterium]